MDYLRILILGAGAVGLYYGGRLARAGHDVVFQARGLNLAGLREDGLHVSSIDGDFVLPEIHTVADAEAAAAAGPYDLILVTVKAYQTTSDLLEPLAGAVSEGGLVVTLQNGVESTLPLCGVFNPASVIAGIAFVGTRRTGSGSVSHTAAGRIVLGEDGGRPSARIEKLAESFRAAGIDAIASDSIRREQWRKLIWNAPFNGMTALSGSYPREMIAEDCGRANVKAAMMEVIAVAQALGIDLDEGAADETLGFTAQAGPVRTSMLVDRELGRPLEVDALYGPPTREGQRLGVPTPILSTLYSILCVVDRRIRSQQDGVV